MISRRRFLAGAAAAPVALGVPGLSAQSWPSRPIRVVVPLPPGGSADSVMRMLAEPLRLALGQPILVENRVGADGRMAAEYVSKQPPDGYTLLTIGTTNAAHASLFKAMPYDITRDFAPVGLMINVLWALIVSPAARINTPKEYLELARSSPGKVTFGSSGVGSPFHLAGEMFKSLAGVDMLHVPYKGAGPVITALLSGEVMSAFAPVGPFLNQIRSGRLRALGILNGYRSPVLPDLPTLEEAFPLPGFVLGSWVGLVAPAGTPKASIERLNGAMVRIVRDPLFAKEHLVRQGYDPLGSTPEQMGETIKAAVALYARIVRDARIPAE